MPNDLDHRALRRRVDAMDRVSAEGAMPPETMLDRLNHKVTEALGLPGCARMPCAINAPQPGDLVVTTDDGVETREHIFRQPPTVQELLDRAGPRAFVVTMRWQRPTLRQRLMQRVR